MPKFWMLAGLLWEKRGARHCLCGGRALSGRVPVQTSRCPGTGAVGEGVPGCVESSDRPVLASALLCQAAG